MVANDDEGHRPLPYRVEHGGTLFKDAAALAGLGTIGKNNLLITPEYGPHVRFKAMFLDVDLEPTSPIDFTPSTGPSTEFTPSEAEGLKTGSGQAPCEGCDVPCRRVCPQEAFGNGSYSRALCDLQMGEDVANKVIFENWEDDGSPGKVRKYCRACELTCPVA